jgi:hypothetical protein
MRQLMEAATSPDFPLLGARLAIALSSAPITHLLDLQAADQVGNFWQPLVKAIVEAEDDAHPEAALQVFRSVLRPAANIAAWAADELARLPGQPVVETTGLRPPPAETTAPPAAPVPDIPAPRGRMLDAEVRNIRGLLHAEVSGAIRDHLGCDGRLPEVRGGYLRDYWRLQVPESNWTHVAGAATRTTVRSPSGRQLTIILFIGRRRLPSAPPLVLRGSSKEERDKFSTQ